MELIVRLMALLPGVLLCASSCPQSAGAMQLDNMQGVRTKLSATRQLLPVCDSSSAPAIAAEMPGLMASSRPEKWWEHSLDDDTRCKDVSYARPARMLSTSAVPTAVECAASCR
jgi:hypothetical protein